MAQKVQAELTITLQLDRVVPEGQPLLELIAFAKSAGHVLLEQASIVPERRPLLTEQGGEIVTLHFVTPKIQPAIAPLNLAKRPS